MKNPSTSPMATWSAYGHHGCVSMRTPSSRWWSLSSKSSITAPLIWIPIWPHQLGYGRQSTSATAEAILNSTRHCTATISCQCIRTSTKTHLVAHCERSQTDIICRLAHLSVLASAPDNWCEIISRSGIIIRPALAFPCTNYMATTIRQLHRLPE